MQVINVSKNKRVFEYSDDILSSLSGIYIFSALEERSVHFDPSASIYSALEFIEIREHYEEGTIEVDKQKKTSIKDLSSYEALVEKCRKEKVYLDITGMTHSVWAPLIKKFLENGINFSVIYVEPDKYKKSPNPTGGEIYDLSEKIDGIMPIPGFASFPLNDDDFIFVPVLGFEGARFSFMVENIQPLGNKTFPVIGVPGFRAEYPFYAYYGNKAPLRDTKSSRNVIYAKASCPFSLFFELCKLSEDYPNTNIKIGLMGTKPHALGGVLFRLFNPKYSEIVYDHPIRKPKRTEGAYTKYIFDISDFFENLPEHKSLLKSGRLR
jgi:hypothetical protein